MAKLRTANGLRIILDDEPGEGHTHDYSELTGTPPAGTAGDSAYDLAVSEGFSGSLAEWLVSLHGPDGAKGATGQAGASGSDGAQGATGVPGATGSPGVTGSPGATGAAGATGATGVPGVTGAAGVGGAEFPVGWLLFSAVNTNPGTFLGYGTWAAFGSGRMPVFLDSGDTDFDAAEETGGAKTVTLTAAQSGLPAHNHQILRERSATTGGATTLLARTSDTSSTVDANVFTANVAAADATQAHNNMPPYIVIYGWKRVS